MGVYDKLIQELAEGELSKLQKSIYYLLKMYPDGLTRHQLVEKIYEYTPTDINSDTNDRKIRRAINHMRKRLFPIVSNSQEAGYKLDTRRETVVKMLAELSSRIANLQELKNATAKFYNIPEYEEEVDAVQTSMF